MTDCRRKLRDYGFAVGRLRTGACNSLTDVPGVKVGHVTLSGQQGGPEHVCTGVTAILPHQGNLFQQKTTAAAHVVNGFGKTTGLIQVEELGVIESPILLTNTFSVPAATEGVLRYMLERNPEIGDTGSSLNVVVGECNDSYLNDMRGMHVRPCHAVEAILSARSGEIAEGAVGAGTGMRAFGWKGGIGTSSRQVEWNQKVYHIGALVLTNFGAPDDLTVLGHLVGPMLKPLTLQRHTEDEHLSDGSIIIVIGTDLPVDAGTLKRFSKRATFGLARTGSIAHHGSGDIVIAFSNAAPKPDEWIHQGCDDGDFLSECFRAVVEATEESILNSLFAGRTTTGRQNRVVMGLPVEQVLEIMSQ